MLKLDKNNVLFETEGCVGHFDALQKAAAESETLGVKEVTVLDEVPQSDIKVCLKETSSEREVLSRLTGDLSAGEDQSVTPPSQTDEFVESLGLVKSKAVDMLKVATLTNASEEFGVRSMPSGDESIPESTLQLMPKAVAEELPQVLPTASSEMSDSRRDTRAPVKTPAIKSNISLAQCEPLDQEHGRVAVEFADDFAIASAGFERPGSNGLP